MAAQTLSIKQVQEAFGVAHMTIHNWRLGTASKAPLPVVPFGDGEKPRVSFKLSELKAWAKKHKQEFVVDPASILERDAAAPGEAAPRAKRKSPAKKVSAKKGTRTKH